MVPVWMTLTDLWPGFHGTHFDLHGNNTVF